jgi:hypothetical protein
MIHLSVQRAARPLGLANTPREYGPQSLEGKPVNEELFFLVDQLDLLYQHRPYQQRCLLCSRIER